MNEANTPPRMRKIKASIKPAAKVSADTRESRVFTPASLSSISLRHYNISRKYYNHFSKNINKPYNTDDQ
ncbi:MAG TPA: hypothetical protein VIY08_15365 [Candidatus Nitrosocosmicus sp.]